MVNDEQITYDAMHQFIHVQPGSVKTIDYGRLGFETLYTLSMILVFAFCLAPMNGYAYFIASLFHHVSSHVPDQSHQSKDCELIRNLSLLSLG